MQSEGARRTEQFEPGFFRQSIPFEIVTGVAASDKIVPIRAPATRARDDVVEGQFMGRKYASAKLASVAITQEQVLARE
jgi:hypothetical protein